MKKNFCLFAGLIFLSFSCTSYSVKNLKTPVMNDATDDSLVTAGIEHFEAARYSEALDLFNQALTRNPENLHAIYELALTYSQLGEYQLSNTYSQHLFKYNTDLHAKAYVILGNNADHSGKPKEAVRFYQKGIQRFPNDLMLRYNLAITYMGLKNYPEAKSQLKKSLLIRPTHASSHLALGSVLNNEENTIPSILAYTRFLILENRSARSEKVRQALKYLLFFGVSRDTTSGSFNVRIQTNAPKNEGHFKNAITALPLTAALYAAKLTKKEITEKECLLRIYDALFLFLSNDFPQNKRTFIFQYYVPYFMQIRSKQFTSIMVDYIFQYNEEYPQLFLEWSRQYPWPESI